MSPWEPGPRLLGNLYIIILGTLTTFTWKTWDPCREPWRNLEGTFWEPFGNREGTLRNLGNLGNLEGTLGTLGTLSEPWEPWEPLLGNLGTFTWEPLLGNLGTFTWEPLLGNLYLEPGNLGGMGFGAAPVCSETFTMAEDPKAFCCWGKTNSLQMIFPAINLHLVHGFPIATLWSFNVAMESVPFICSVTHLFKNGDFLVRKLLNCQTATINHQKKHVSNMLPSFTHIDHY